MEVGEVYRNLVNGRLVEIAETRWSGKEIWYKDVGTIFRTSNRDVLTREHFGLLYRKVNKLEEELYR